MDKIKVFLTKIGKKNKFLQNIIIEFAYLTVVLNEKCNLKKLNHYIHNYMEMFLTSDQMNDRKYRKKIIKDLILVRFFFGISYEEYFLFDLENKDRAVWKDYVGLFERFDSISKICSEEERMLYRNKRNTYSMYKQFYKRELISVVDDSDKNAFYSFISRNKSFICKPIQSSCGRRIRIINIDDENNPDELFKALCEDKGSVIEEIIKQDEKMASFHKESVNTVRVTTFYDNGNLIKMFATLRIGVGDSIVDNASAGGISASVDVSNGVVITDGFISHHCRPARYERHPESNALIKGNVIPKWDELMSVIDELVKVNPKQKIVGWDMALTNEGWIMIEANSFPTFTTVQVCNEKGIRKLFNQTVGKYV